MFLFFDTETTGLPVNNIFKKKDIYRWPQLIQISWQMYNKYGDLITNKNYYIKLKKKINISLESIVIHGITKKFLIKKGKNLKYVLRKFIKSLNRSNVLIGHNIEFDINIIISLFFKYNYNKNIKNILNKKKIDTQKSLIFYNNKWISLKDLFNILYNYKIKNKLHNSYIDLNINILCYLKLIYYKIILINYKQFNILNFFNNIPLLKGINKKKNKKKIKTNFFNIHNHTHFNVLNSTIKIEELINKAINNKMKAVGICDNNLMGVFDFINYINKVNKINKNKIKGIIGYNIYIKDTNNNFYNHVLIVKNTIGYYNLIKISSYSYLNNCIKVDKNKNNNIYYIEKEIVEKYSKGLIFLTGNLKSEISQHIIKGNIKKAEKILLYWKKIFKKDIYIEIFINNLKDEKLVNKILLKFSKKHKILYINQCDVYYLNKKDYIYHDILFCIRNKIGFLEQIKEKDRKNIKRLENKNFYFKNYFILKRLYKNKFKKGFYNLKFIYKKIEKIKFIKKDFLPKKFKLPNFFLKKYKNKKNINYLYLKYITYQGAKLKYGQLNNLIILRIKKELKLIKLRNFTNYFLIVKDIIDIAKKIKVDIGPGRGSVAGSIIAYCIGITRIDPIKYKLLFERFLNIYRKKMPDIDLDLNYKTRKDLIYYIKNKYNFDKVCNIITYGKIGAKTAIRDCARVFNMPLKNVSFLTELMNNKIDIKDLLNKRILNKILLKKQIPYSIYSYIKRILNVPVSLDNFIINIAKNLVGLIRNIGIHACGIIMSNVKLKKYVPLISLIKNITQEKVILTQFNAKAIEDLGLLKIDLLGLRTLAVLKESIIKIKKKKKKIKFNLKDKPTYTLFKHKLTSGVFQYESKGINLLASKFEPKEFKELIAFNALYRPGPIQYIPSYIERKNNREKVTYDLPIMKECLKDTYGITIYQEQVILLAKIISGINQYEADLLREAIGKKNKLALITLKAKFFNNSLKKGYDINILKKIWKDWESFASYAFNKSHATCYAYITFKTAYIKKHYYKEFLSCVLNNNLQNRVKYLSLLNESKYLNAKFLLPNINISKKDFYTEKNKYIRYSLCGIKGIGEKSTKAILDVRLKKKFTSIFDFLYRINLRIINKRLIKILILTGSFDLFGISKYKYFINKIYKKKKITKIEYLINEITKYKKNPCYDFLLLKKKYNNFFNITKEIKKKVKNDKNLIYYNEEQLKYLGYNFNKDLYYKKHFIFNIYSIYEYNKSFHSINNNILLSGIITNILKNSISIKDYNCYTLNINKVFYINFKELKIKNKNKYKKDIVLLKILNNKIIDIKFLKNILKNIEFIIIKIYEKFYYKLSHIILKDIKKKLMKVKIGIKKNILFKIYDINKKNIKKENLLNINVNTDILYDIRIKYKYIYFKI
ncbi:MAG: DNA polymerase III subunit alpha [Candidatus Shikimatogenerans bostrichidophilus]|nr:MAG: DNA polymerase III subunit alpha [Candidatus Shikimatogenerans bostrichidophilus]